MTRGREEGEEGRATKLAKLFDMVQASTDIEKRSSSMDVIPPVLALSTYRTTRYEIFLRVRKQTEYYHTATCVFDWISAAVP